jgi:diamine N-acetyltransferase
MTLPPLDDTLVYAKRVESQEQVTALSVIAEKTFRQTFEHHHDLVDFEGYVRDAFSIHTLSSGVEDLTYLIYLAPQNSFIPNPPYPIGYFHLRQRAPADLTLLPQSMTQDTLLELERFYLDAAFQAKGFGSQMMRVCINIAREHSDAEAIWLCVWEENQRAIRFYERLHFTRLGLTQWTGGDCTGNDYLMLRSLTA